MLPSEEFSSRLKQPVLSILERHPSGITEFNLFKQLQLQGHFKGKFYTDQLSLFQNHFLLFHILYTLRDELIGTESGDIEIHTLNIQLLPYNSRLSTEVYMADSLADYYLNIQNLRETSREDVEKLFKEFTLRMKDYTGRDRALRVLGLRDPVQPEQIKKRFRELVKTCHPDRGGNHNRMTEIVNAMEVLS